MIQTFEMYNTAIFNEDMSYEDMSFKDMSFKDMSFLQQYHNNDNIVATFNELTTDDDKIFEFINFGVDDNKINTEISSENKIVNLFDIENGHVKLFNNEIDDEIDNGNSLESYEDYNYDADVYQFKFANSELINPEFIPFIPEQQVFSPEMPEQQVFSPNFTESEIMYVNENDSETYDFDLAVSQTETVKCNLCNRVLKSKVDLDRHMKNFIHYTQVISTIQQQNQEMMDEDDMDNIIHEHEDKMDSIVNPKPKNLINKCNKCGIIFKRKAELNRHIKSYEKMYKCAFCDLKFGRTDALRRHIRNRKCKALFKKIII